MENKKMLKYIEKLLAKEDLSMDEMKAAMDAVMSGEATEIQMSSFLTALRMKGETAEEVGAAASVMRRHATFIDAGAQSVIDTCGTGGDKAGTFNISTTTAFVAAGAGISVAKHGNRSVSSKCGSADVLEALGVKIDAPSYVMEECIQDFGIGFLFAPCMHPAMKNVMGVRKGLGIRTIFNMLGPLTNPAAATGQVLGVFAPDLTEMFATALQSLGTRRALVVHGHDCLDEITSTTTTRISELRDGNIRTYEFDPEEFIELSSPEEIKGGDAQENAEILRGILDGSITGGPKDIVLLNAAAAIIAGEKADDFSEGIELAKDSIESGKALEKLEKLVENSQ
jgi:anthranilate phosphoribosyltransferase